VASHGVDPQPRRLRAEGLRLADRDDEGGGSREEPLHFEWDPAKSALNKVKHGLDFDEALAIWLDPGRAVVDSKYTTEPRQLTIGLLDGRMYTAITTIRGGAIRIISVRRSRREEEELHG